MSGDTSTDITHIKCHKMTQHTHDTPFHNILAPKPMGLLSNKSDKSAIYHQRTQQSIEN